MNAKREVFAQRLRFHSLVGRMLFELQRGNPHLLFEESNKVIIVGKAADGGDLRDVEFRLGLQ